MCREIHQERPEQSKGAPPILLRVFSTPSLSDSVQDTVRPFGEIRNNKYPDIVVYAVASVGGFYSGVYKVAAGGGGGGSGGSGGGNSAGGGSPNMAPFVPPSGNQNKAKVVCRAYYKLEEVLRRTNLKEWSLAAAATGRGGGANSADSGGGLVTALDVGAAPGGWSYQLASKTWCNNVIAVDPSALSQPIPSNVIHVRKKIEICTQDDFQPPKNDDGAGSPPGDEINHGKETTEPLIHLMVNDMNASPVVVKSVFHASRHLLHPGSGVCLTLKSFSSTNRNNSTGLNSKSTSSSSSSSSSSSNNNNTSSSSSSQETDAQHFDAWTVKRNGLMWNNEKNLDSHGSSRGHSGGGGTKGATNKKKCKITKNRNCNTDILVRDDADEGQLMALRYQMHKAVTVVLKYLTDDANEYCDASTIRVLHLMKNGIQERTVVFRVPCGASATK